MEKTCQANLEGPERHSLLKGRKRAFQQFESRRVFTSWRLGTWVGSGEGSREGFLVVFMGEGVLSLRVLHQIIRMHLGITYSISYILLRMLFLVLKTKLVFAWFFLFVYWLVGWFPKSQNNSI